MPGVVPLTVPTVVFPKRLCTQFVVVLDWPGLSNDYATGENQRSILVGLGPEERVPPMRRRWKLAWRRPHAEMAELEQFFLDRLGGAEPFLFYDPYEVLEGEAIGSNWDAEGINRQGRYIVHFSGDWRVSVGIARSEASIELVELGQPNEGGEVLDFSEEDSSGHIVTLGL